MAWCWCILLLASHRKRSDSVGDGDWDGGYDGGDGVISLNMQRYKLISTTNFIVQVDEENTVLLVGSRWWVVWRRRVSTMVIPMVTVSWIRVSRGSSRARR